MGDVNAPTIIGLVRRGDDRGPVDLGHVAIQLHDADDVAVAKADVAAGTSIKGPFGPFAVSRLIPRGHKIALRAVESGDPVRRYGQTIGFATARIAAGDHVHTQNMAVREFSREPAFGTDVRRLELVPAGERRTFQGYLRADGRVGTRNYVAVIASVNCSATACRRVAERCNADLRVRYPHVDGVIALTHHGGCGARYGGHEVDQLQRTLAGFARHANVGGFIIIGLGCEINQIQDMVAHHGLASLEPTCLVIQEEGGLAATIEAGVDAVSAMLPAVDACRRSTQSVEHLMLALQCGGSDAWSGVTANPALGYAADRLVLQGGTAVLAETTEVYGAEHLLTRRARSREVGEALLERIRWWEQHTAAMGCEIDNNPSPGNKAGGLTTIYEKSLGAIAKSGTTPLNGVYKYAEPIDERGFVHMDSPGYDPVSVTGQVASGCNLVAFTTGRGSVFGFKPVPSIKIATNSALYQRMTGDMDVNAGRILEGATVEEIGVEIFDRFVAVASGEKSKSEAQDVGDEEFSPWMIGATL
jgi:altronate hydrolase